MATPTSRDYDWTALVKAHEGKSFNERPVEYQFANGKVFKAPAVPYQSPVPGQA